MKPESTGFAPIDTNRGAPNGYSYAAAPYSQRPPTYQFACTAPLRMMGGGGGGRRWVVGRGEL